MANKLFASLFEIVKQFVVSKSDMNTILNKDWYYIETPKTKNIGVLTRIYNKKYGDYNVHDLRLYDLSFANTFTKLLYKFKDVKKILVVGANNGYEINFIRAIIPNAKIVALDISTRALKKLQREFPNIETIHADMEILPCPNNEFDLYISCRAINSTNVAIPIAISEAVRVSKNVLISISNGYLIEDQVQKGMFDYDKKIFDIKLPWKKVKEVKLQFKKLGLRSFQRKSTSEIFIAAKKILKLLKK